MSKLLNFIKGDDGAITVDWVVITAAIVGLCISTFSWMGNATHDQGETVGSFMSSQGVKTSY